MRFAEIPDQTKVKQVLVQSVRRQHVAHAQLFRGAEGSAALGLALAYATFLNCEGRAEADEDSCGWCSACQKLDKLVHPDLNFIVPVTSTKQVPKDAVSSKFAADWRTFVLDNPYQGLNGWMQHIGAENKQGSISKEESLQLLKLVGVGGFWVCRGSGGLGHPHTAASQPGHQGTEVWHLTLPLTRPLSRCTACTALGDLEVLPKY